MKKRSTLFTILISLFTISVKAQEVTPKLTQLLQDPESYVIHKATGPIAIDGQAAEDDWRKAKWTDYFTDIEGHFKPAPTYATRVKMLWDDENLYIYAELEEPHVWGTLKTRDAVIFQDNDFEVFISNEEFSPEYFELEVNALGTIWDLLLSRPYRDGGKAINDWDMKGLKHAIHVEGTLNNPDDIDKYWAVELAIPFRDISFSRNNNPPKDGDLWRINFSRVHWEHDIVNGTYQKRRDESGKPLPEYNWVWSPQGLINMHFPERWGYLLFTSNPPSVGSKVKFQRPEKDKIKEIAWFMYYLQKEYYKENKRYAKDTLGLVDLHPEISALIKNVKIENNAGDNWFVIKVQKSGTDFNYMIDHNGILSSLQ